MDADSEREMKGDHSWLRRRTLLGLMAAGATGGCLSLDGSGGGEPTTQYSPEETERRPDYSPTPTSTPTPTATSTATPADTAPPQIISYTATPENEGAILAVTMEAEDNRDLGEAAILYGDQEVRRQPDGRTASLSHEFVPDADAEPADTVTYVVVDTAGQEAQKTLTPDETAPELAMEAAATDSQGEISLSVEATDDVGLQRVAAALNGEPVYGSTVTGTQESRQDIITSEHIGAARPGAMNTVRVSARDRYDNSSEKAVQRYMREFSPMDSDDLAVNMGAFYVPFFQDDSRWVECTDATPAVGRYSMEDREAVSRHVDLMQGFGINRMIVQADVPGNLQGLIDRLDEPLPGEMPLEVKYHYPNAMDWRGDRSVVEQFNRTTEFLRDNLLSRESYVERDGGPVVTIWNVNFPLWNEGEIYDAIQDEWGSYAGWVDYLRGQFTVDDSEPYLVGMVNNLEHVQDPSDEFSSGLTEFDGLTHWFGINAVNHHQDIESGETTPWDAVKGYHEEYYPLAAEFTDENGMDFIPTAFYGFDDRPNECWGDDTHVPRSTGHLAEMLQLADEHRTTDRIHLATFNDWAEGHMLEPGTFNGQTQGTEYLQVVREFQQG